MTTPKAEFDINTLSLEALQGLRAAGRSMPARRLGQWIYGWADFEQARRARGEAADAVHAIGLPPVFEWSDADVGAALESSAELTFMVRNLQLGEFVDRLAIMFVAEASRRLRKESIHGIS